MFSMPVSSLVSVRYAETDDCDAIFLWRNDLHTRQMSFKSSELSWEDHLSWFSKALVSADCILLICTFFDSAERIGVVRFDAVERGFLVSINLSPNSRGRGLAHVCLLESIRFVFKHCVACSFFEAKIKFGNCASVKTFEKAGFEFFDRQGDILLYKLNLNS